MENHDHQQPEGIQYIEDKKEYNKIQAYLQVQTNYMT